MKLRTIILWTAALGFAGVLEHANNGPSVALETGVVYVYFPSSCATRDTSTCSPIADYVRPAFEDMAGCMAFADHDLAEAHDANRLGSCMKEREA